MGLSLLRGKSFRKVTLKEYEEHKGYGYMASPTPHKKSKKDRCDVTVTHNNTYIHFINPKNIKHKIEIRVLKKIREHDLAQEGSEYE